jgi:hypothetical protein
MMRTLTYVEYSKALNNNQMSTLARALLNTYNYSASSLCCLLIYFPLVSSSNRKGEAGS